MTAENRSQFSNQKYINLETYKKSGAAVSTPVWFVEQQGIFYVGTPATSGKIKRIRRNAHVRVAPSTASGRARGTWAEGEARIVVGPEAELADQLLNKKYGWQRKLIKFLQRLRNTMSTIIAIELEP